MGAFPSIVANRLREYRENLKARSSAIGSIGGDGFEFGSSRNLYAIRAISAIKDGKLSAQDDESVRTLHYIIAISANDVGMLEALKQKDLLISDLDILKVHLEVVSGRTPTPIIQTKLWLDTLEHFSDNLDALVEFVYSEIDLGDIKRTPGGDTSIHDEIFNRDKIFDFLENRETLKELAELLQTILARLSLER